MATHHSHHPGGAHAARHRAEGRPVGAPAPPGRGHAASARPLRTWLVVLATAAVVLAAIGGWWLFARPSSPGGSGAAGASFDVRTVVGIGADGRLRATERIAFSSPRSTISVSIPRGAGVLGEFTPQVDRLMVQGVEFRESVPSALSVGDSTVVRLPKPVRDVAVSYSATGVVHRSQPAPAGRALVLVTPLAVADVGAGSWKVQLISPQVTNLGCAGADGELSVCGSRSGGLWSAEGGAGKPVPAVVAQLNLPK